MKEYEEIHQGWVEITLLNGPFAGVTRIPPSDQDPQELIQSIARHGWQWEIDYSHASKEEAERWYLADVFARISRAVFDRRPVYLLGESYLMQDPEENDGLEVLNQISSSLEKIGYLFSIGGDDEHCLALSLWGKGESELHSREELVDKIAKALAEGRTVFFLGKTYRADHRLIPNLIRELEDDILATDYAIAIGVDDERHLVINIGEREN